VALARQLFRLGHPERAANWFRQILVDHPFDAKAAQDLIACLWQTKQWGEAATFLRKQLDLVGKMPGLLYAYGKSLFEAGDMSGAVSALTESLALANGNDNLKKTTTDLRERALQLGGTILPPPPPTHATGSVTRQEFEAALEEFGQFISKLKRMEFWQRGENDHEWIAAPERQAQNFLHIYLQARFGDRVEIFEELDAGAGRLDLYVRLIGGLAIVVELKMCGFGYARSYAAAGEDQIIHYMDNRNTHLGYLVAFDAHLEKYGEAILSGDAGPHTVIETIIHVRPRIGRRKA
jgi:tetratricopeptide (TPR) repeat protein